MTISTPYSRRGFGALMLGTVAACGPRIPVSVPVEAPQVAFLDGYGPLFDAGYNLDGIPPVYTQGINRRMTGAYQGEAPANSLDVDPYAKFLYHVKDDGTAVRYPIGVGRAGRSFSGTGVIRLKKKWPGWTPTQNMLRTEPDVYGPFRRGIPGGLRSPLGARALYLFRNGRDTFYRIHGTNDLNSIGNSGSAGCIRLFNHDIIHLYDEVPLDIKVLVRSEAESLRVDPEHFGRGVELPAKQVDPEEIYGEAALANDRPPDFDAVDPDAPIEESFVQL
jgi:lipoprotein-anchoring transpeptidase ErfK/SrfK